MESIATLPDDNVQTSIALLTKILKTDYLLSNSFIPASFVDVQKLHLRMDIRYLE